jgi:hypothetical protein
MAIRLADFSDQVKRTLAIGRRCRADRDPVWATRWSIDIPGGTAEGRKHDRLKPVLFGMTG